MVRAAAEHIQVRHLRNYERDIMKLLLMAVVVCIAIFPMMSGNVNYERNTSEALVIESPLRANNL